MHLLLSIALIILQKFGEDAEREDPSFNLKNTQNLVDTVYNVLLIAGIIVAAIVGLILGIQFITGSVEQKGKIKEAVIPYVVGCVIIFGAFGIWKMAIILLR